MKKIIHAIYLALIISLSLISFYQLLKNKELEASKSDVRHALILSAGRLATSISNQPDKKIADDLRLGLLPLGLTLISEDIDFKSLDAEAFEGMCVLIKNADKIFPTDVETPAEKIVYPVINKKLELMEVKATNEATSRRLLRVARADNCLLR